MSRDFGQFRKALLSLADGASAPGGDVLYDVSRVVMAQG